MFLPIQMRRGMTNNGMPTIRRSSSCDGRATSTPSNPSSSDDDGGNGLRAASACKSTMLWHGALSRSLFKDERQRARADGRIMIARVWQ